MAKIFGLEHIIFLVLFIIIATISLFLICKFCKTEKSKKIAILTTAGILLATIIWNRTSLAIIDRNWLRLIPNTYCGLTSFIFSIAVITIKNKNHPIFHCITYIAIIGGILTLIYPTFISQGPSLFLDHRSISGMVHHGISLYLAIMLLITRDFVPSSKKWYCLPLGLAAYVAYGLFLIQTLKLGNSMDLEKPLVSGTPFTWYFMVSVGVVIQVVLVFVYELIQKKLKFKK